MVSYWRMYVHEVLVNRLGGLSLPRKSVVRLTDRPDMTLDIYRGRKTTMQQQIGNRIILAELLPFGAYLFVFFPTQKIRYKRNVSQFLKFLKKSEKLVKY